MTVPSQTPPSVDYAGNGSSTSFSTTFVFLTNDDVVVTRRAAGVDTVLTEGLQYTLTGAGQASGGTVVLATALAVGQTLTIERDVSLTQDTNFRSLGSFSPALHERALDKLTMAAQQLNADIDDVNDAIENEVADRAAALADLRADFEAEPGGVLDERTVLATGSTTARKMKTRFAEVINAMDYELKGDGTTESLTALQAAIDAAAAGTTVYFPRPGAYYNFAAVSLSLSSKTGIRLIFSKASLTGFNIQYTGSAAAIDVVGSTYCTIENASIKNTNTSAIGIRVRDMTYELDIEGCHVQDGIAGIQIGTPTGGNSFNIRVRRFKAESTSDAAVTLSYGILMYACVNISIQDSYVHRCTTGYKRIIPTGGPTAAGYKCSNIRFDFCIAERCQAHGYDLDAVYSVSMNRAYVELWGEGDATPTSYAIKLTGFTYAQMSGVSEAISWNITNTEVHDEGSQSGGGYLFGFFKFFHTARIEVFNSTIPRTRFLYLDDADATAYGQFTAHPVVIINATREYGAIEYGSWEGFVIEDGVITGGNGNIDGLSPGIKAHIAGAGIARGLVAKSVVGGAKFAPLGFGIRGQSYLNFVCDADTLGLNKFIAASPNNGFDDDRAFNWNFGDAARGFSMRSSFWNSKLTFGFDNSYITSATIQATEDSSTAKKLLQLNPGGGGVQLGPGTYLHPVFFGTVRLWVSSAGKLYINTLGQPANETDGTIVGTQS